jgi:hypothetical protein
LRRIAEQVGGVIEGPLRKAGVRGPVGVDAFVYREGDGLRMQPLLEINPRWTMGRVALALGGRLHPRSTAVWTLHSRKEVGDLQNWASSLPPLELRDQHWFRGALCTNDPATAQQMLGVLRIEEDSPNPSSR